MHMCLVVRGPTKIGAVGPRSLCGEKSEDAKERTGYLQPENT